MISRRAFLGGSVALLAAPVAAEVQQAGKVPTVGILTSRSERSRPFEDGLRELGWVEGKTIRFERRFTVDYEGLPRLARELVRIPVEVIFAGYSPAVRAAMDATRTIPIIAVTGDPVSAGFIKSIARPGGNVTGVAIMTTELSGKRLEILTQALPTARLIAVVSNPSSTGTKANLRETEVRARALGVQILRFEATGP